MKTRKGEEIVLGVSCLWAGDSKPKDGIPLGEGQAHRPVHVGSLSGVVLEFIF